MFCSSVGPDDVEESQRALDVRHEIPDTIDMAEIYEKMVNDKETADCAFLVGPEESCEKIFAHQCVLKVRCPQLACMFTSGMLEGISKTVRIEECLPSTFLGLLVYIYSGRCSVTVLEAISLYVLARKYLLIPLAHRTLQLITAHLSAGTVVDMLVEAQRAITQCDPHLIDKMIRMAVREASSIPHSTLCRLPVNLLQQIVGATDLRLTESEIFSLVHLWAQHALRSGEIAVGPGRPPPSAQLRALLEPLLQCVRLGVFSSQDILNVLEPSGLFTQEELLDLYRHAADPEFRMSWLLPHQYEKRFVEGGELAIRIVTQERIDACDKVVPHAEFFDWEKGSPHIIQVKDSNRWCDLQFLLSNKLNLSQLGRLWILSRRHHQTPRPDKLISPPAETMCLKDVFGDFMCKRSGIDLFVEPARPLVDHTDTGSRETILLLFRHYEPHSEVLSFVGHGLPSVETKAGALIPVLNAAIGQPPGDPLLLYEVVGHKSMVLKLDLSRSLRQLELINGDLVVFQSPPSAPSGAAGQDP
eukprot:RCo007863